MATVIDYYDVYKPIINSSMKARKIANKIMTELDKKDTYLNKLKNNGKHEEAKKLEADISNQRNDVTQYFKDDNAKHQYDLTLAKQKQNYATLIYESDIDKKEDDALQMRIDALYTLIRKSAINAPLWENAIVEAKKIIDIDSSKPDPYFVIATAQYELGNYSEAINTCDIGVKSCVDNLSLRRIQVHYNILCEKYQQAQQYINQAINDNLDASYFYAKQAFLYLYAQRNDLAVNAIKEYLVQNPSDVAYREIVSSDLLYMARACYVSDGKDNLFIIDKESYTHCLNLVTIANQIYSSEYNSSELAHIQAEGAILYSEDKLPTQIAYGIVGVIFAYLGMVGQGAWPLIFVGAVFGGLIYTIRRYNYRPVWQIHRDEYRGFREKEDNLIYNIAMIPSSIVEETANMFRA